MGWNKRSVNPGCANASNPFHVCAEYCARGPAAVAPSPRPHPLAESATYNGAGKPPRIDSKQSRVELSDQNSVHEKKFDAGHNLGEISGCDSAQDEEIIVVDELKLERKQYKGESSSSSSVLDCDLGESSIFSSDRRKVDPACPNSSNPFHVCADYCKQKILEIGGKSGENSIFSSGRSKVDPACPNSSNPFHVCADYCKQKMLEMGGKSGSSTPRGSRRIIGPSNPRGSKGAMKVTERKDVHPNCVNASNPFHKCSDYCFQGMNVAI